MKEKVIEGFDGEIGQKIQRMINEGWTVKTTLTGSMKKMVKYRGGGNYDEYKYLPYHTVVMEIEENK